MSTELFIMRHGHAQSFSVRDELRELSDQGVQEVELAVTRQLDALQSVEKIIVSPFRRAQQSADIVCKHLTKAKRENLDLIVPSGSPEKVIDYFYRRAQDEPLSSVMIVSHLPLVGLVLETLCDTEPGFYCMGTASLAAIDVDEFAPACAQLRWLKHTH
ncbi:MAG: phosphohistidine phosphatase SixA [Alteromonadaceae bacterium]|nr:MAG: phosphohistidine phosphatase SixA [Alteromonadaceae bacterium]